MLTVIKMGAEYVLWAILFAFLWMVGFIVTTGVLDGFR